jgi:hypothetical protein
MTQKEMRQMFDRCSAYLRAHNLDWYSEEVPREIRIVPVAGPVFRDEGDIVGSFIPPGEGAESTAAEVRRALALLCDRPLAEMTDAEVLERWRVVDEATDDEWLAGVVLPARLDEFFERVLEISERVLEISDE